MLSSESDDNSLVVARIFEFLDGGREDALGELVSPRYVDPQSQADGVLGITRHREWLHRTFGTEARVRVQALLAEGDEVAVRWTLTGRHLGTYRGSPPTERPVTFSALSMFRLEDGRVVEAWVEAGSLRPVEWRLAGVPRAVAERRHLRAL